MSQLVEHKASFSVWRLFWNGEKGSFLSIALLVPVRAMERRDLMQRVHVCWTYGAAFYIEPFGPSAQQQFFIHEWFCLPQSQEAPKIQPCLKVWICRANNRHVPKGQGCHKSNHKTRLMRKSSFLLSQAEMLAVPNLLWTCARPGTLLVPVRNRIRFVLLRALCKPVVLKLRISALTQ